MPNLGPYTYEGPIDHTVDIDQSCLEGKSVVVTGGANGIGEAFVRAFVAAGAFVTFGDINEDRGHMLENELGKHKAVFVKCDISSWDDQVHMFDVAVRNSPSKSCDVVIANAGISRSSTDSLWDLDEPEGEPVKPDLNIVHVNMYGTLYTWKLAVHYFRKQPDTEERDRCFIIIGSMVAWIDSPANWEYAVTKYGLRGLMRTARHSSWEQGIRINYVAPCYVKSAIRSAESEKKLIDQGVEFASSEDVAACILRIASEPSLNGHSLMIVPRSQAKEGFMDVNDDDYTEDGYFKDMQEVQLRVIKARWTS